MTTAPTRALIAAGALVAAGALAWVAAYLVAGDKVPRGTTVAGVAVGGLSEDEAAERLEDELAGRADRTIEVTVGDRTAEVSPQEAGLSIDFAGSAAAAGARKSWSPAWLWDYATGGDEVPPVLDVDDDVLAAHLSELGDEVRTEPVEGGSGSRPRASGSPILSSAPSSTPKVRARRSCPPTLTRTTPPPSSRWPRRLPTSTRTTSRGPARSSPIRPCPGL